MTPYQAAVLADSPSGFWPLTDTSGSATAVDLSGHGNTGTATSVGFQGGSKLYDGTTGAQFTEPNSVVNLPLGSMPQTLPLALEVWIKPVSTGRPQYLMIPSAGVPPGLVVFQLGTNGNTLLWGSNGGSPSSTVFSSIFDGKVHQAGVEIDGSGNLTFYVDGAAVGTASSVSIATTGLAVANFISFNNTLGGTGTYAWASAYSHTLGAARWAAHYAAAFASSRGFFDIFASS